MSLSEPDEKLHEEGSVEILAHLKPFNDDCCQNAQDAVI